MMTADRIAEIRALLDGEGRKDCRSAESIEKLLTELEALRQALRATAGLLVVAADGTADPERLRMAACTAREIATR